MSPIRLPRPINAGICWYFGTVFLLLWVAWTTSLRVDPGWSADDGVHLRFSSVYSAAQYLLHPDVLKIGSYANLTPVLHLFYSFNLAVFGLDPAAFRIVVATLSVLCVASLLACLLGHLNHWLALYVAAVFATSVPFFYTAATFMTGHYLIGLLGACLCLFAFSRWLASNKLLWLGISVFCFALAVFSKEVYVPLIGLLLLHSPWRRAWRGVVPMAVVLTIYFVLRHQVLGSFIGGYRGGQIVGGAEWMGMLHNLVRLPLPLFGGLLGTTVAGGITLALMVLAPWRHVVRFVAASSCALLPLLPLLATNPLTEPDRYFLVATAMFLVGLAWLAQAAVLRSAKVAPWHLAVLLLPLWGVLLWQQHRVVPGLVSGLNLQAALYRDVLARTDNLVIVNPGLPAEDSYWSATLNQARDAQARLAGRDSHPRVLMVSDRQSPLAFGLRGSGVGVYEFDRALCQCLKPYQPSGLPSLSQHGLALERLAVLYVSNPKARPENHQSAWGNSTQNSRDVLPSDPSTIEIRGYLDLERELDWLFIVLPFQQQPRLQIMAADSADLVPENAFTSPFVLRLHFASPQLAARAHREMCLSVPGILHSPYALLKGQPNYCNAFVNDRLLRPVFP